MYHGKQEMPLFFTVNGKICDNAHDNYLPLMCNIIRPFKWTPWSLSGFESNFVRLYQVRSPKAELPILSNFDLVLKVNQKKLKKFFKLKTLKDNSKNDNYETTTVKMKNTGIFTPEFPKISNFFPWNWVNFWKYKHI